MNKLTACVLFVVVGCLVPVAAQAQSLSLEGVEVGMDRAKVARRLESRGWTPRAPGSDTFFTKVVPLAGKNQNQTHLVNVRYEHDGNRVLWMNMSIFTSTPTYAQRQRELIAELGEPDSCTPLPPEPERQTGTRTVPGGALPPDVFFGGRQQAAASRPAPTDPPTCRWSRNGVQLRVTMQSNLNQYVLGNPEAR